MAISKLGFAVKSLSLLMNKRKMIEKKDLDYILALHKAQSVGNGYLDIIVKQEYVHQLIQSLVSKGIRINRISWWEYVDSFPKKPKYGMGGPKSDFFDGWFSELHFVDDEIDMNEENEILKIILNKEIHFPDGEIIRYREQKCLTPALWLEVPDDWKNMSYLQSLQSNKVHPLM